VPDPPFPSHPQTLRSHLIVSRPQKPHDPPSIFLSIVGRIYLIPHPLFPMISFLNATPCRCGISLLIWRSWEWKVTSPPLLSSLPPIFCGRFSYESRGDAAICLLRAAFFFFFMKLFSFEACLPFFPFFFFFDPGSAYLFFSSSRLYRFYPPLSGSAVLVRPPLRSVPRQSSDETGDVCLFRDRPPSVPVLCPLRQALLLVFCFSPCEGEAAMEELFLSVLFLRFR